MADDIDDIINAHRLVGEKVREKVTNTSKSGWNTLEKRGRETGRKLVPDRVAVTPGKSAWRLADLIGWVKARPVYEPPPAPRCTKKRATPQVGSE